MGHGQHGYAVADVPSGAARGRRSRVGDRPCRGLGRGSGPSPSSASCTQLPHPAARSGGESANRRAAHEAGGMPCRARRAEYPAERPDVLPAGTFHALDEANPGRLAVPRGRLALSVQAIAGAHRHLVQATPPRVRRARRRRAHGEAGGAPPGRLRARCPPRNGTR
jgi:hypothetical protein